MAVHVRHQPAKRKLRLALTGLFVLAAALVAFAATIGLRARAEGPAGTLGPPACTTPIAIESPYTSAYSCFDLGAVPSLPTNYGGLTFKLGDPNTIIIGGAANGSSGALYTISVVRDAGQHVTGFSGEAVRFADAADNDGGVVYGPGGVLFLARWPSNGLGEIKPGSSTTDRIVDLNPLGVCSALSALNFVPSGFPGEGLLKFVTYSGGCWYTASYELLSDGTYGIPSVFSETTIAGGPEGFIYVPPGSPNFPGYDSMLVSEYGSGSIAAYQLDANGDPEPASRTTFISGLTGAEGAVIDPLTGDFLFSTFGGANHVVRVSGFAAPATATPGTPTASPTSTATPTPTTPAAATPTATISPTFTVQPSPMNTPPAQPAATATATQQATATYTPFPTFTPTATFTLAPPTNTPLPPIVNVPPVRLLEQPSPSPTRSPTVSPTRTSAPTATSTPSSGVLGTENPPDTSGSGQPAVRPARGAIVVGPEPRTTGNVLGLDQLSKNPKVVGTNFLLAIILLIVLLFTSTVFNGTLDEHRVEVQSFMRRFTAPFRWLGGIFQREEPGAFAQAAWAERIIGPVLLLGITCLIYTFNESGFGWNGKTAALFTSLVIGVGVTTYVVEGGEVLITTRRFRVPAGVRLFPIAIAIAGGFVLLSRVTSFEAPIMYGFIGSAAALTAVKLDHRESAFAVLVPALVLLALSLAAWFLLIPLRHAAWDDSNWWAHVPSDTAALIFAAGIEGLLFTMIPVRFTDGAKVFRWYKLLWAPLFLIPAFLFSWVLLNPAAKGFDALIEGRVIFALALVGAYVASTAAFWAFFALRDGGEAPHPPAAPPSGGAGGGGDAHAYRPALAPLEGDLPAALPHTMPVYLSLFRLPFET